MPAERVVTPGTRFVAASLAFLSLGFAAAAVPAAGAARLGDTPRSAVSRPRLTATITAVSPVLRSHRRLTISGTVTNPGSQRWLDARVYVEISPDPASTLRDLNTSARTPDAAGFGTTVYTAGLDLLGNLEPHQTRDFNVSVPYSALPISRAAGVYRAGVKVVATSSTGVRDVAGAAQTSTLVPQLVTDETLVVPAQTVTLLPLTAPVKRLLGGAFADDSLASSIGFGGRLYDVMAWALRAPPDTVQVVVDPALLTAVTDMSHGYRVAAAQPNGKSVAGRGEPAAITWMINFGTLLDQQHVMLMPWGDPAANSLLHNYLPGPVVAAVRASTDYLASNSFATDVVGWVADGRTGISALEVLHHAGAGLQIVAQSSLPALSDAHKSARDLPSLVEVVAGSARVPALVTATNLAGLPTTPTTSALQFRQRLVADATVRSMSGDTDQIRVTALPFGWDPGAIAVEQDLTSAFALPVVVAQSAIGAADHPASIYSGPVRPGSGALPGLQPDVISAIRSFRIAAGDLAEILLPAAPAQTSYQHALAMAGSDEWRTFPQTGVALITAQAGLARADLAKVTVTGPPFVAMSSASGRFPLTITNGLDQAVHVRLAVMPEDPALAIGPLAVIALPAGQRRDIQVVSTAQGSGVTSVRARLATPGNVRFGKAWTFDVRATQIGLVIWVVMAVGGGVLFVAAGYRIVNRLRGSEATRREPRT